MDVSPYLRFGERDKARAVIIEWLDRKPGDENAWARAAGGRLIMTPFALGLMLQIAASGRMVSIAESPSQRIAAYPKLAPGQPPLLSFRYFEGKDRRRFTGLDLVLDNAGH